MLTISRAGRDRYCVGGQRGSCFGRSNTADHPLHPKRGHLGSLLQIRRRLPGFRFASKELGRPNVPQNQPKRRRLPLARLIAWPPSLPPLHLPHPNLPNVDRHTTLPALLPARSTAARTEAQPVIGHPAEPTPDNDPSQSPPCGSGCR